MSENRLIQLDFLRACCVVLVLGRHLTPCPEQTNWFFNRITTFWNYGGWVGVDLFFVLSGFLVSGLLFREYKKTENARIKRFLIRRGLKIYPAFYVLIIATILINPLFGETVSLKPVLAEIFFLQNVIFARLWAHTWSLAVEEHFYIGLAILVYYLLSRRRRKKTSGNPFAPIPYIFLFAAVTCFVSRLLMAIYRGTSISPTPFRIDALFFGVLLSYLWHFRGLSENAFVIRRKRWLVLAGALMLTPMFFFMSVINPWAFVVGLTTNYVAGGLILIGLLKIDAGKNAIYRTFSRIGVYSYSIYLWHLPVQDWLAAPIADAFGIGNWFFFASLYLAGAIMVGILMSKIIEYPVLRIRDKYYPPMRKSDD